MRAVVVALGKIGLPLAAQLATCGHEVIGCDIDERVVDAVNGAQEPFPGEADLADVLQQVVLGDGPGHLQATTDTRAAIASRPELVILVPPLMVDAEVKIDWRILDAVIADVGAGLREGATGDGPPMTIALETTVPVGTSRSRLAPALEAASGLREGEDFHVVFSPERVFSGRIFADLATYPKLVGGLSAAGEIRGVELYARFLPDVEVRGMGGAEAAELTKLAETTYRDVNIALANEFARHADELGLDVQAVIDAANSQPFSHIHRPGVAVGGHCIPVYPRFYLAGDPAARLPAAAREVNEAMPAYAVDLLGPVADRTVLILGVAYRGGVKETAFSGAYGLRDELTLRGARPVAADPLYDATELAALGFSAWTGEPVDAAVLQADHAEYASLTPAELPGARIVVDGRGVLDPAPFAAAGVALRRIGRP
ncbi:MAG: nucleotide sugar dehydrogenase [Solirubrobacterales bacterium]|nr:nucleotide sugar dehydrogenase [Solirubrobacterales bacterium]